MSRRSENGRIKSAKRLLSPQVAIEFCRQPKAMVAAGSLMVVAILAAFAFIPDADSVAESDLTDEQLESDFLALGALGVSDSANPAAGKSSPELTPDFNPDFEFEGQSSPDSPNPDSPNTGNRSGFMADSSVPDFGPADEDDMARFGRPIIITDPRSESAVEQAEFEQENGAPSAVVGARVTANQAVWLTGSIETQ